VKPWFNGKVDIAPPVVDLTAQGFTLLGGRLDYIDGKAVASIVYRRRTHVINLFVAQGAASEGHGARLETMQGFNIRRWSASQGRARPCRGGRSSIIAPRCFRSPLQPR